MCQYSFSRSAPGGGPVFLACPRCRTWRGRRQQRGGQLWCTVQLQAAHVGADHAYRCRSTLAEPCMDTRMPPVRRCQAETCSYDIIEPALGRLASALNFISRTFSRLRPTTVRLGSPEAGHRHHDKYNLRSMRLRSYSSVAAPPPFGTDRHGLGWRHAPLPRLQLTLRTLRGFLAPHHGPPASFAAAGPGDCHGCRGDSDHGDHLVVKPRTADSVQ
jgi:hypothetical protein